MKFPNFLNIFKKQNKNIDPNIENCAERSMIGALFSRMSSWVDTIMAGKVNADIMTGLLDVISKTRGLAMNDTLVRSYLSACRKNIIGKTGFELQCQLKNEDGTLDEATNDEIEWEWYEFGKTSNGYLTIDGRNGP